MAARSRRFLAQRSGLALAALLVASLSVHDHRVAAALQGGLSDASSPAVGSAQPAHLVKASFGTVGTNIYHHYP